MIIYVFNGYLDNSGFAVRCRRGLDALSYNEEIVVLCRSNKKFNSRIYKSPHKLIPLIYFSTSKPLVDQALSYKPFFYELSRNIQLMYKLGSELFKIINQYKNYEIKIYVVSSPLTVPLIAFIIGKLFGVRLSVLEMHDLEPEMAKHIKHLKDNSLLMKIEYFLEKFLCNRYEKIVVTNNAQFERIIERTKVNNNKVYVVPNLAIHKKIKTENTDFKAKYQLKTNDLIIGYVSSLSYDYTITGLVKFIKILPDLIRHIPNIRILIIGDGVSKELLERTVNEYKVQDQVIFTGNIPNVQELLQIVDIAFIPWDQDDFSETILPTKLFEYMLYQKAIVAPNFGEFKRVLKHREDSLLYNSFQQLNKCLLLLNENKKLREKIALNANIKYHKIHDAEISSKKLQGLI